MTCTSKMPAGDIRQGVRSCDNGDLWLWGYQLLGRTEPKTLANAAVKRETKLLSEKYSFVVGNKGVSTVTDSI